ERERLVNRPTTAEGLITNATLLPLDTFMVVLSAVFGVPPPSVPPISVHDSVSALKLKLPLLWAKLSPDPNVTIRIDITKNDTSRFICFSWMRVGRSVMLGLSALAGTSFMGVLEASEFP